MLTMTRAAISVVLSGLVLMLIHGGVHADVPECPPGSTWNGAYCEPDEETPPDEEIETGCTQEDPLVSNAPCRFNGFVFSPEHDRYLRPLPPEQNEKHRPPDGELSHLGYWVGPPDEGHIYEWQKLAGVYGPGTYAWGVRGYMWLADGPGEPPPVDPEEVAETILDGMDFELVEIGLAPKPLEQNPESIGVVG